MSTCGNVWYGPTQVASVLALKLTYTQPILLQVLTSHGPGYPKQYVPKSQVNCNFPNRLVRHISPLNRQAEAPLYEA
jgi:hypothetical protein